jgi:hypothetical protein
MPTKDGFTPNHPLPLFLSEHAEQPEQPGIGRAWHRAAISSRILKTGMLVVTAAAIDFAILSVGNPVALFASVTASLVDASALQPGTGQSAPTIQSTAGLQDLTPAAQQAPTRDEIAAALKAAHLSQTETGQPSAEASLKEFQTWAVAEETGDKITAPADALLKQFQSWAAEEEARTQVGPVPPAEPVQDAPAQAVQNDRAQDQNMDQNMDQSIDQPMPKRRQVRPARAEIRPVHNPRAKVRREQNARLQARPAQDARAQDGSGLNAQAPSLLQSLGLRN